MKKILGITRANNDWARRIYAELDKERKIAEEIFADLDTKMYSSGVYKKINVRSYSLIRKKYGVAPKRK